MYNDIRPWNRNPTETILAGSLKWAIDKMVDLEKVEHEGSRGLGCERERGTIA